MSIFENAENKINCTDVILVEENEIGLHANFELEIWNDNIYDNILEKVGFFDEYKKATGEDYDHFVSDGWFDVCVNIYENGLAELQVIVNEVPDFDYDVCSYTLIRNEDSIDVSFLNNLCNEYAKIADGQSIDEMFEEYRNEEKEDIEEDIDK